MRSITDEQYVAEGATILATADEVWAAGDLLVKVKEPIAEEYPRLRDDQMLFTYLHLAASRPCTDALLAAGTTSIAYETVQLPDRSLPLLSPMSEVAGRLAAQVGANQLMSSNGGGGMLMGGVAGTAKAKVVVIGGGVAGEHAAANALGMGAEVTVVDLSMPRLRAARGPATPGSRPRSRRVSRSRRCVREADLVIGSVLIPGAAAPKLVTDAMVSTMKPGRVLVDIAIDQGGCFEGSPRDDPRRPHLPRCTTASTTASPTCPAPWPQTSTRRSPTRRCPTCC